MASCTCDQQNVFIGIDFGVTFSGTSTAIVRCNIHPGHNPVITRPKIPSVLHCDPGSNAVEFFGSPGTVTPRENELRYFKLALMGSDPLLESCVDENIASLLADHFNRYTTNMSASKTVSIFLKGLWNMAAEQYKQDKLSTPSVSLNAIVTWPSCWSEETRQRMKEAVDMAGISTDTDNNVHYITEHEAAVKAIVNDYEDLCLSLYMEGNSIIVVDCGGMTTDAATYRFTPASPGRTEMGAIVDHKSHFTGSAGVDSRYKSLVLGKIKNLTGLREDQLPPRHLQALKSAMDKWHEKIKPAYNASTFITGHVTVEMPDQQIKLHRDDIINIFDPVIQPIFEMVLALYNNAKKNGSAPKALFLTGGLGCNPYIQFQVKIQLRQYLGRDAPEVVIGTNHSMRTAVCRGAALHGTLLAPLEGTDSEFGETES